MRRIVLWAASTVVVLVLLFGYRTSLEGPVSTTNVVTFSAAGAGSSPTQTPSTSGASGTSGAPPTTTPRPKTTPETTTTPRSVSKTVTGSAVMTNYGPVQVQITTSGRKLTNVAVLQYPNTNGRDAEINGHALPILVDETMQAGSAQIDMVSGATYTSQGYLQSLQAALDRAGL
jgi:uncharacterized protein with FMN-binding domain